MGNCCGGDDKDQDYPIRTNQTNESASLSFQGSPNQYQSASRDELAAAAERRLAEQKAKTQIKSLRTTSADLPEAPNTGQGLRWQVG